MTEGLTALCWTAAIIAAGHTLLGPDHYLPFVAMGRARRWSINKTLAVTALCGVGHVLGSVLLGMIGIALGTAVFALETIEAYRGEAAAWLLIGFGMAYLAWGVNRAIRRKPHSHYHVHADGVVHRHQHTHTGAHLHVHDNATIDTQGVASEQGEATSQAAGITPWMLFTVFIFGPCEPLIPLLMYPAAAGSFWHVAVVALVFAMVTIASMVGLVALGYFGARFAMMGRLERYAHALAGSVLLLCGIVVKMGL